MEEKTDIELVALARNGDKDAFGLLVQRYQAPIRRFGMRLVADQAIAEELAQEAILQAYLSLDHLRDSAKFKGWLYGILLNVCRSYIRDQKAIFFSSEEMVGGLQFDSILFSAETGNPERVTEELELHNTVLDAVNSLAAKDRDVTLWFYYEQLSTQEIAEIQNTSVGAVKVRLHRARKKLKSKLLAQNVGLMPENNNRRKNMVKVSIFDVIKQERSDGKGHSHTLYVIVLQDEASRRVLPIWTGSFEGQSIARALSATRTPRPMTFSLFSNILQAVKARVEQVRIETLKDDVFYATVKISHNQAVSEVDARPSDALTLAALAGSPVFVAEDVLAKAGIDIPEGAKPSPARSGVENILKEAEQAIAQPTKSLPRSPLTRAEIAKAKKELISTIFSA
mgnify:CR=1 FL=1